MFKHLPSTDTTLGSIPSTMVIYACHPGTWEMEAEGSEVQSQPLLHSKFQASLDYVKSCQERKKSKLKEAEGWGE